MDETTGPGWPPQSRPAGTPDLRRSTLPFADLAEEELDPQCRSLAAACRSALDVSRAVGPRPDPAIQSRLRGVVRARRSAASASPHRTGLPFSRVALGLAAVLLIYAVPDRLFPAVDRQPPDLLAGCRVAHAPIDAFAGLEHMAASYDRRLRGSLGEAALPGRAIDAAPLPADST